MVNRSFSPSLTYITYVARRANVVDDSRLWHKRLSHLNFGCLKYLLQRIIVEELPFIEEKKDIYEGCALKNHHRQSFPKGVS